MITKMKIEWVPLEKPLSVFTTRNTVMWNLNNGAIVQHYSANTKLSMAEKAVTENGTYYRTLSAAHHYLNFAFEASALGLPNEFAPSAPKNFSRGCAKSSEAQQEKQKSAQPIARASNDGEKPKLPFWKKFFRREKK